MSGRASDFNEATPQFPVYPHTWLSLSQSTESGSVREPITDEGYNSSRAENVNLTTPPEDAPVQQEDSLSLSNSPSRLLLSPGQPGQGKSKSVGQVPSLPKPKNIWRTKSDSKASSETVQPKHRLSSILTRTFSRSNLAASSTKGSMMQARSPTSARGRRSQDLDIKHSIDLTKDGASAPSIVRAAQDGSRDEVERLIGGHCNLEARHERSGRTALLVAAHCGNEEVINLLIQSKALLTAKDGSGSTALHLAASRGHCGVLEILLPETNLLERQDSHGRTPLWVAADRGQLDALRMLIRNHAKINARAENHMTALHAAAKEGDDEVVQLLLAHGADLESKDGTMMTALHYACRKGHIEVVDLLLDHRAEIEALGRDRKTPLIFAAEAGKVKVVERLLKLKASVRHADEAGMNAFHWAAYNGHEDIALRILSEKKSSLTSVNSLGQTALHLAVSQGQFPVVESLLRKGASPGLPCKTGLTALHYACIIDNVEIATLLLLHDSDVEAQDQQQQRPLHIAAAQGSVQLLDLLCDKGASLDARDVIGDRALCVACRNGRVAAAQKLLDRGSPLYLKIKDSHREDSPLCLAAMGGHLHVASLLLQRGASARRKDEVGKQPFHYAAFHGHPDVLQLLLSCSKVSALDIPDNLLLPEPIGFSSQAPISDEKKRQVQHLLWQALEDPESISNGAPNGYLRAGSHQQSSTPRPPVQGVGEASDSSRPELPATLEQGLPSSRSATPSGMRGNSLETPAESGLRPEMQGGEQVNKPRPPPVVSNRVVAFLEDEVPPSASGRLIALLEEEAQRTSFSLQRERQISTRSRGREQSEVPTTGIARPVPIRRPSPTQPAPSSNEAQKASFNPQAEPQTSTSSLGRVQSEVTATDISRPVPSNNEAEKACSNPEVEQQTSAKSQGQEQSTEETTTYIARPRCPSPTQDAQSLAGRYKESFAMGETPRSSTLQDIEAAARVPRTIPPTQEPQFASPARSQPRSQPQPGIETHDYSAETVSDDSDSMSAYTASEGDFDREDSIPVIDLPEGVYEMPSGLPEEVYEMPA